MSDDTPTPTDPAGEAPAALTEAQAAEPTDGESPSSSATHDETMPVRDPDAIPDLVEPPAEERSSPSQYTGELPGEGLGIDTEAKHAAVADAEATSNSDGGDATAETNPGPVTAIPAELAGTAAAAPVQTVYVTAPLPPRARGNRGAGVLLALAAAVVFAVLLAVVATLYRAFAGADDFGGNSVTSAFTDWLPGFLAVPLFYVPVSVFLVLFILFVVIANRAGWGVYVLGSFLLAVALYFASVGVLLALAGIVVQTNGGVSAASLAVNPAIVIATVLAREVTIWFGAAIGTRGRRVKARNADELESYRREITKQKAELERAQYGSAF